MLDPDANTAKTLTLVTIILQALFFVFGLIALVGLLAFFAASSSAVPGSATTTVSFTGLGLITAVFSIGFAIGIVWLLLEYFLIYKKLAEEKVAEAETPAIVLGIITLLFGGVITGILLIVAYVKIRDSRARSFAWAQQQYQTQPPPPPSF